MIGDANGLARQDTGNDTAAVAALAIAGAASPLLSGYQPHDSLFSSSHQQWHARGLLAPLTRAIDDDLAGAAERLLAQTALEHGRLPLLGAVPFDRGQGACLWLPSQAVFAAGRARHRGAALSAVPGNERPRPAIESVPAPAQFKRNVERSLAQIRDGGLRKVVMSRSLRIGARVDVPQLLSQLLARAPSAYTFAMDLAAVQGAPACLIGSSPELLLAKRGARIVSNPLAGSIPRVADPDEDARRARGLLESAKDLHEHALVVEAVAASLAPYCRELQVPATPSLLATPTMWHLSTRVDGVLKDPATSSLRLALALHPTPAVCGAPTQLARDAIRELEGYDRGLFTGLVGWCDADGDGEWAVTIRCALVEEQQATVFAGAGIVAGSEPEAELTETSAKLGTMLGAMGLAHAVEAGEGEA
ncbi:isochorismate synthase [Lysobacter sp. BMK333-48F3]|uniref:isochorismate synthase n=1 Tax=Lysobacter sp. BMK333-48F3 TaxID=2867962 RepID=UPI001C8B42B5|nr:isochorismate synthase [Lysobacter sp. BMK333-48F3]MBX9403243.1 isochorismate synthase [Lysobacter sp. BMK333-48F3]